jgi:pyruvate/2-oxoglutarate dehydrogenase complex dihydrolipoamide acyltransferase (E2) component
MSTPVLLPKVGFSMDEGTVAEWLAADGSLVVSGQPLYSLESEKSVQEIESPASGRLQILSETGISYKVGTLLAEIGPPG